MNDYLSSGAEKYAQKRRRLGAWYKIVICLACVVVFVTTYILILPAVTMSRSGSETGGKASVNGIAAQDAGSYRPVTADDGEECMALVMYYCSYDEGERNIGGYNRHQLTPGGTSDGEQVIGENIQSITNNYRFRISGAYTDGTDYLIPVSYFETVYKSRSYVFDPENPGTSPFICGSGSSFSEINSYDSAKLLATDYVQLDEIWYVRIKAAHYSDASAGYMIGAVYYAVMEKATDTVDPNSTVIHMFDYWTTGRYDSDNHTSDHNDLSTGINADHALKFGKGISGYGEINYSQGGTQTPSKITQGIVANLLGDDRYPHLSGILTTSDGRDFMPQGTTQEQSVASLAYLFDPYLDVTGKRSFPNVTGLLRQNDKGYYCFDSRQRAADLDEEACAVTQYTTPAGVYTGGNISGQFFPFNDSHRTALLNADGDPMNHYFGLSMTARFIQQYGGKKSPTSEDDVTFSFSGDNDVWIFIDNVLVADLGGLRSAASVTINFRTGAVIIDDTGTTGNPTGTPDTTIREAFIAADPNYATSIKWNGDTLPDDTLHTLKFYYLERGNYDSNLMLEYNLNQVPLSGIYKVDQYENKISGARFAVYRADESYNYIGADGVTLYSSSDVKNFTVKEWGDIYNGGSCVITPAYCDSTDEGEMIFVNDDGMPYSMEEMEAKFGKNFILREVYVPNGYRTVSDEIHLSFDGGVMFCDNVYEAGVWASANVLVTATNQLYVAREYAGVAENLHDSSSFIHVGDREIIDSADGTKKTVPIYSVNYYLAGQNLKNGTLFSVVLKRNGRDFWQGFGYDYWFPVYGSDDKGYTVVKEGVPDEPSDWSGITFDTAPTNIRAVLTAAKAQAKLLGDEVLTFQESGNGMQLLIENLPGKISRYYSWMNSNNKLDISHPSDSDPQYVVAYYWTTADSIEKATEENTVRVYSHDNLISGWDGMKLQWSTTIEVPNLENRLYFQKLDTDGNKINDATFALYDVIDAAPKDTASYGYNYIYYVGTDTKRTGGSGAGGGRVYVAMLNDADEDGNNAVVFSGDEAPTVLGRGIYDIDGETGEITVTIKKQVGGSAVPTGAQYYVYPAVNADGDPLVGKTHDVCRVVAETGTGHFNKLTGGKYFLREISAPAGYALNTSQIPVLVNRNGVYANAGTEKNGVSVGNGIGYVTKTLDVFASKGEIDETLTWVLGALIRSDAPDFSAFDKISGDVPDAGEGTGAAAWSYVMQAVGQPDGYGSGTTPDLKEAMVTYLEYAPDLAASEKSIFDYTPTDNQSARTDTSAFPDIGIKGVRTLAGEGQIRLFTDEGWSDLAIYQDHAYGRITTDPATNYDDLTELGNISNLFSSSTFVRVTDTALVDVAVNKVSESDVTLSLSGAQFRLYRMDGETRKYYSRSLDENSAVLWTNEEGATVVAVDPNAPARFVALTDGTYYLEEIKAPDGYYLLTAPVGFTIAGTNVKFDENSKKFAVGYTGKAEANGRYLITITVSNESGYKLPDTGGAGTLPFTAGGILIMAAAVCLLLAQKERRDGAARRCERPAGKG